MTRGLEAVRPNFSAVAVGVAALLVVLLIVGLRIPARLDPRSSRPDGALGLVELLDDYAASVEVSGELPTDGHDVAILLVDGLSRAAALQLDRWVLDGGTLVVADPDSPFAPAATLLPGVVRTTECDIASLRDVAELDDLGALAFDTKGADAWCLGTSTGALVVAERRGDGLQISVAGNEIFENRNLPRADNAALAVGVGVRSPSSRVVVLERSLRVSADAVDESRAAGPSSGDDERRDVGDGDGNITDLLPEYLRWIVLNLALAWVAYALAKGRRFGKPIPEVQPVEIAASELVAATGRLYRNSDDGTVERHLVEGVRGQLAFGVGLPRSVDDATLAQVVADRAGIEADQVRLALAPERADDDAQLVTLTRRLDFILQEVRSDRNNPIG